MRLNSVSTASQVKMSKLIRPIPPIVALITDFGLNDGYVAELKLAIYKVCPEVKIIDISHNVSAGDIRSAAYLVQRAVKTLPDRAVIIGIVDPGVGSARQAVIIKTQAKILVGPDNGLFTRGIDWIMDCQVRIISAKDAEEDVISTTFHGRDLFGPVAGRLASGVKFEEVGIPGQLKATFPLRSPVSFKGLWFGEVVYIDRFGNIITDIPGNLSGDILIDRYHRIHKGENYQAIEPNRLIWLTSSDGNIEIAAKGRRADRILSLQVGARIYFQEI